MIRDLWNYPPENSEDTMRVYAYGFFWMLIFTAFALGIYTFVLGLMDNSLFMVFIVLLILLPYFIGRIIMVIQG